MRQQPFSLDDVVGNNEDSGSRLAGSETSEDEFTKFSSTSRTNDESNSDEESILNDFSKALPVRTASSNSDIVKVDQKDPQHRQKSFVKKVRLESFDGLESDEDSYDGGPLLRLGEMIVVDWNPQAYDAYFCGDGTDNRGQSTWNRMPSHKDDTLLERRKHRSQRRKNGIVLDDCLDEFGKEETLSEMDTWYCPRCREHRRANKKLDLWRTPDILIIHLKRFSSSGRRRDKLDIRVDFPIEGLDLTSRVSMSNDGKKEIYDLIAVDNHWGGLGGGHYTAHARNFHNGEWYEYNDSSVSKIKNLSEMVSSSAYLLFYRRRSDLPLGGPRLRQIIEEYDNKVSISEDEISEQGEDQALVGDSSLHGSSSASIGAGAIHHLLDGSDSTVHTLAELESDQLPSYGPQNENDENSVLLHQSRKGEDSQENIEDEGFADGNETSYGHSYGDFNINISNNNESGAFPNSGWDFSGLSMNQDNVISRIGSDDDLSSERVQYDSSPSQISNDDTFKDIESICNEDTDSSYVDDVQHIADMDIESKPL